MSRFLPIYLLLLAACGDNAEPTDLPDGGGSDSGIDAPPPPVRAVVATPSAMFMAGQPGSLNAVDIATATPTPSVGPAMAVGSDPVLRKFGDELFVVNRGNNNITILRASDFSFVEQISTGAGSNPQDVAVVDNNLFVATFGNKGMVVVPRGQASATPVEIDLSADDPDDNPNCNSVRLVDDRLFVSCELLDDTFAPRGNGKVYVVDPTSRQIAQTVTLTTKNPINLLEEIPNGAPNAGDLAIGTVDFATGAGCLERITTGTTPTAAGCIKSNQDMGGYAARFGVHATGTGATMWLVVSDTTNFTSSVKTWDMSSAAVSAPRSMAGEAPLDVAVCPDGQAVVTDAPFNGTGGVRIYDGAQRSELLSLALNPASVAGTVCY